MASKEVESLGDCASNRSSENSEETSETEAIGKTESSSTLSGKFRSDVWSYFTRCTNGTVRRLYVNCSTVQQGVWVPWTIFEIIYSIRISKVVSN